MKIKVKRTNGDVVVQICRNKSDNTYSFVNLTKNHICECRFSTVDEAIEDMNKYKNVLSWEFIK